MIKRLVCLIGHGNCYICWQKSTTAICCYCERDLIDKDELQLFFMTSSTHAVQANLLNDSNIKTRLSLPYYSALFALARYKWPISRLVMDLKFSKKLVCADIMTDWLRKKLHPKCLQGAQALIPVPISTRRYIDREYNQANELAERLSKLFTLPVDKQLRRKKHTKAQAQLDKLARQTNVENAFEYFGHLAFQHIVLVDDVITTGATINHACLALLAKQADLQITVLVMAVSVLDD